MIYILYSNDYEVYLGGNRVPEQEVLIDPTERLLSGCADAGIPMTLFCDVACLWRYRELGYEEFPDLAEAQLQSALQEGHDIQAHLHPHWLTTSISRDQAGATRYDFELPSFLLGHSKPEDGTPSREFCTSLFLRARFYLEELLRPVDAAYRCVAFRAGGFGIQPEAQAVFSALRDSGYLIDSSIVPGLIIRSNVNQVDFSGVPEQGNYPVAATDEGITAGVEGVFELPIAALRPGRGRWPLVKALTAKVLRRLARRQRLPANGYTIQSTDSTTGRTTPVAMLRHHLAAIRRGGVMLELRPEVGVMVDVTHRYVNQLYDRKSDLYFAFLCHSKSADSHLVDALTKYHRRISRMYGSEIKAITFQEAARSLALDGAETR
jgi:hypothetical protein